jgi:hypothetical protein
LFFAVSLEGCGIRNAKVVGSTPALGILFTLSSTQVFDGFFIRQLAEFLLFAAQFWHTQSQQTAT